MRNIYLMTILVLLVCLSAGCLSKAQPPANPNNSNASNGAANSANPTTPSSPAAAQQDMTQSGAAPQPNAANLDATTTTLGGADISMLSMDYHSSLVNA